MNKIDFSSIPIYDFNIFDNNKNFLFKGLMNSKAWNKTLETGEIWEYINENGRVIGKDFFPLSFDLDNVEVIDNKINIYLSEKKTENENSNKIDDKDILKRLEEVISKRKIEKPDNSYTTNLFEKGLDKILKKLGEEAIELIIASKDDSKEMVYETADLLYHIMVLFVYKEIPFNEVLDELSNRMEK
ncbi:MAG TPA: phosphoribosyl-ATP diphosphatase [Spirochaetota bacterium]|nr:phosphoribosyl-ATP diphosphatase [Spirochaetota bacterium]